MPDPEIIKHEGVWIWVAGIIGTLYAGAQIFILRSFSGRISVVEKDVKKKEDKDSSIPRPECERTHASVDNTLIDIKKIMADGFKNLDDKIGEVHSRINQGR